MAKLLNGKELSLFVKEQQAREVRSLKQSKGVEPKLVIIRTNSNPVTDLYVGLKVKYGEDIGVKVEVADIPEHELVANIDKYNSDESVHGIIVQLPLINNESADEILKNIAPEKDVDGLGAGAILDAATPTAINWLLAGYNIDLAGKNIVIVGKGKLVGSPLAKMWEQSGYSVAVVTISTKDKESLIELADVIVSATGTPGVITSEIVKPGAVVVDAGAATDSNGIVGDVAPEVRLREDITITPEKGGVGPLTVCALFHNVLIAARKTGK